MQVNKKSEEINILTDILKWASENQKMWYRLFRACDNDELCYEDLIDAITKLTEKKHYILLFVLISQNRYNCHLDEIFERAIFRFCAEKVEEDDIQKLSQFVIKNLNIYASEKEKDEKE